MRIAYDAEADALVVQLCDDAVAMDSVDLEEGVTALLDAGGHVIGLEILDARERLGDSLASVAVDLPLPAPASHLGER